MKSDSGIPVEGIIKKYGADRSALLEILKEVKDISGVITDDSIDKISGQLNMSKADIEGVATFYHFFSRKPSGRFGIYLNDSAVSMMKGCAEVAAAFEKAAGVKFGEVTGDGLIGLHYTSDIGMNDQEPAAIINGTVFTELTAGKAESIISGIRAGKSPESLAGEPGDGKNSSPLVKSMVKNNIMKKGAVLFASFTPGSALDRALSMTPEGVIDEIKKSQLRGRGGAGFPAGMKWDFTRQSESEKKYIICNADEGEPGTFKDRVLLTETPELLFEGMAIAGYAVGADEGVLYLRAEYLYLKKYLESVLDGLRKAGHLGKISSGGKGFSFDIKIIMGAGAYVCGEESALIESAEGKRGEPRNRPPFPAQRGFMNKPTSVNNVETFCCAARIMVDGGDWFAAMGTAQSKGTKLVSVSGDCKKPGIYEIEFGTTVQTLLEECDGRGAAAVQMGGPSGLCIDKTKFGRRICFDDLATGGSVIVIGPERNLLDVVSNFMHFFVEESCGWCTPCRAGNQLILHKLHKITSGSGTLSDLKEIEDLCKTVKNMSRCGLGQTSPNPVLSTLENFRGLYEAKINKDAAYVSEFNMSDAVKESCAAAGRKPIRGEH